MITRTRTQYLEITKTIDPKLRSATVKVRL